LKWSHFSNSIWIWMIITTMCTPMFSSVCSYTAPILFLRMVPPCHNTFCGILVGHLVASSNYTTLEHINVAKDWALDHIAKQALSLVDSNIIGVCRLHKHFDIDAGEIVVTEYCGNNKYKTVVSKDQTNIVPWQWKYDLVTKIWIPCEYFRVNLLASTQLE